VVIEGVESGYSLVHSGVPQGSILGPLLFIYYVNDLSIYANEHQCEMFLYADDAKICKSINNINDCVNLQASLTVLNLWCVKWGMKFNSSKSVYISFGKNTFNYNYSLNGEPLLKVEEYTDLGLIVNSNLKWDSHVNTMLTKANKRLGFVKRSLGYKCHTKIKLTSYKTLVRPILEFGSTVWSGLSKKSVMRIESLQRRASSYILNNFTLNYKDRLIQCDLLPLSYRRELLDIVFYYGFLHNIIEVNLPNVHMLPPGQGVRTRQAMDGLLLRANINTTRLYGMFFNNRITKLWNHIPYEIRNTDLNENGKNTTFKKKLKDWMFSNMVGLYNVDNFCSWTLRCLCHQCVA
jgi:hypothetical protein